MGNGLGGFTSHGREYVVTMGPGQVTPAPRVNVLANPSSGTIVSESGCANTWSENAQEFLLTPWSSDPVSDSSGEAFYLRDEESGHFWSTTPWPCHGIWVRQGICLILFPILKLSVGRENAIGNQGVGVRFEVSAMKLSLPLFQRLLDVDQADLLCGERLAHDDPPAKEAHESCKALLCRNLQANDV
jgi:hypothetical protein